MFYSQPNYSSGIKAITKKTHKNTQEIREYHTSLFLRNLPEDKLHPTERWRGTFWAKDWWFIEGLIVNLTLKQRWWQGWKNICCILTNNTTENNRKVEEKKGESRINWCCIGNYVEVKRCNKPNSGGLNTE